MKIRDDVLLTWLCAFRLNLNESEELSPEAEGVFHIPSAVREQLCERGWCELIDRDGECGIMHITDAGDAASDLFSPETGIVVCALEI